MASGAAAVAAVAAALIDCHAHLSHFSDASLVDVLEGASAAGVAAIVAVSEGLADGKRTLALCTAHPRLVRPCVGLHPAQASGLTAPGAPQWRSATEEELPAVLALIRGNAQRLVGVGEVGLDFSPHVQRAGDGGAGRDVQRRIFAAQLALAAELGLPVNVHSRRAARPRRGASGLPPPPPLPTAPQNPARTTTKPSRQERGPLRGGHVPGRARALPVARL
jgi:TatD DNase family protein